MYTNYKQQFEKELSEIKESGMWKDVGVIEGKQGAEITIDNNYNDNKGTLRQAQGEKLKLFNFCANNYLGLASSEELAQAAKEGIDKYGFGEASVRFIVGTSTIHKDLESEICKFFGTEDAITYSSCFDANTGLFETILKEGDAIFSDELNHASIIDGVRLCKAERFRYKNSDMADLEAQLKEATSRPEAPSPLPSPAGGEGVKKYRPRRLLIATDGVFSMDGITAKLEQICDLAEKYGAMVMVDDSHGSGVLGQHGRGSVEGLMDRIDILTSTFGKALGGAGGGFTAGRKEIIQVLHQRSRTTLFSNSLTPAIANAALYVLQNYDSKFNGLRVQLMQNTHYFREEMEKLGFTLGGDPSTSLRTSLHPITPVMLMEEKIASDMAKALFAKSIYVRGFTYPVVPKGKARIRVQISAAHTKEQMDKAVEAFKEVGKEMQIIK